MGFLKEKRQIAIFVMVVLMAAAFFLFKYLPSRKRLSNVKQAFAEQKLAIMKSQIEEQQLPKVRILLDDLQNQVEKFDSQIPGNRDLGIFLQQMAKLMNDHGLKEQHIQPAAEIETTTLNCIPIDMQCKGTLQQLFAFYKAFQNADRLVRIERVSFDNDINYSGKLQMKAKAIIYYLN